VPPDFAGGTDVIYSYLCDHNTVLLPNASSPEQTDRISGMGIEMPHDLLRLPYRTFLAQRGKSQEVAWAPSSGPTLFQGRLVVASKNTYVRPQQ